MYYVHILSVRGEKKLKILSYESKAVGVLEFSEGKYWFTHIEVMPQIIVDSIESAAIAERTIFEAHENCFLSNSVKSRVIIKPEIKVGNFLTRKSSEVFVCNSGSPVS